MSLLDRFEFPNIDMATLVLLLLVMGSAIAVIYSKHIGRAEFVVLQQLERQRDQLNEEWGRLLLEQSTWASPGRIEQQARLRLQMIVPPSDQTMFIQP